MEICETDLQMTKFKDNLLTYNFGLFHFVLIYISLEFLQ